MQHILKTLQNELANMQVLEIYLSNENNKINNFGPKTLEKIKANTWLIVYYTKDKNIDVLTKFSLAYEEINKRNETRREWTTFNVFTISELINELRNKIKYRIEYIEKTKKSIKDAKKIERKLLKIIELTKEIDYNIYNSEVVKSIADNLIW